MIKLPRVVDANFNEVKRVRAIDASISLNTVPLSTASITVKTVDMIPVRSFVEMYNLYGSVGVFRVRSTDGVYGDDISTIELDHSVAEVGDFICNAEINETSTLSAALIKIFGYYKGSCWQLSAGSYLDSVVVDVDYDNVLEAMLDVLEQAPEYMLTFNFNTRPWTIGVTNRDTSVTAEGRLSRNVTSATVTYDDSDLCTKIYVDYQENNKDKIYTKSSNTGKYGIIEKHVSGSGYTKSQAQTVADTYLLYHSEPTVAVTIDGVELANVTGESLDSFALGKIYRLAIPKYGVVVDEPITGLSWPSVYTNPKKVEVSLASVSDPVVKFIKKTSKSGSGTKKKVKKSNKEYWTKFEQTDEQITMTAAHTAANGSILQQAGMWLDANGLLVYAEDNVNNIGSKFRVQANAISAEVTRASTAEGVLSGRITVEAGRITQEVTDRQNGDTTLSGRITTESNRISLVVEGTGANAKIKAAQIVTEINDSSSSVLISADKIRLDGNTTVSGMLGIENGGLKVKGNAFINGDLTMASGNDIIAGAVRATSVRFPGSNPGEDTSLTRAVVAAMLVKAEVDGNVLTITDHSGNEVSFSKATSLSDGWSGNTYTVTATQNGVQVGSKSTSPFVQPLSSQGGAYVDLYVATSKSESPYYDTHGSVKKLYLVKSGLTVYLKSENSTSSGTVYAQTTCPNPYPTSMTIRQISGYSGARKMKLYYTDNTVSTIPSGFHEASGGSTYWYYSATDLNQTGSNKIVHY